MNETEKVLELAKTFGLCNDVIGYPDFEYRLLIFLCEYLRQREEREFLMNVNHQGGIC